MPMVVPNPSEITLLKYTLGNDTPGNQILRLFINNITPSDTDTAATYTEMSTLGYTSKTLTKTSWSYSTVSNKAEAQYAQQSWTFTAGTSVTVYGYYVTDATTGNLLWAELLPTARPIATAGAGDILQITPKITMSKE